MISSYKKHSLLIVLLTAVMLVIFPFLKFYDGRQITFSKEPGHYDSAFYLSILGGENNSIHYTLDGSEPTVNDPVFDKANPLYIEDVTSHENVYSMRTDTSTGFLTDLIDQYSYSFWIYGYTAPAYPVDKCTVIRASLFNDDGDCLDSITGTYFVGLKEKSAYQNIYTASIVTSPENLFDPDTGIYVTGKGFDRFLNDELSQHPPGWHPPWWSWDANYSNRGKDWEREAYITIFDEEQQTVLSQPCGIRIKGGASRGFLPKSISCYARWEYNGNSDFDAEIFEPGIFPHKIVLYSGGDDNRFKLKSHLIHTLEQDLHFATEKHIPCAMFLDGEYWGMYDITEDYNADYIYDHYQVDRDNIIMIKADRLAEGNEEDQQKYEEMLLFMSEHDMSDNSNYNQACDLIDMESFIDYYASQIYLARCGDWPEDNFALWRSRDNDGSLYGDTKWRWMMYDVELSYSLLEEDTLSYVLTADRIFPSLWQNENFRCQFTKRLLYMGQEVFTTEKSNAFLDHYAQTLREPLAASNKRFYMDEKYEEFDLYVSDIRNFLAERYDVVWDFLVDNMGEEWLTQNGIQK